MRAEELRIGNKYFGYDNIYEVNLEFFKLLNADIDVDEIIHRFVPLTEEWLLIFGFNTDYKKGYIGIDVNHSDFVLTYPKTIGVWQENFVFQFESGGIKKFVEIEFVHQLQNLFFALTGEELELKSES